MFTTKLCLFHSSFLEQLLQGITKYDNIGIREPSLSQLTVIIRFTHTGHTQLRFEVACTGLGV